MVWNLLGAPIKGIWPSYELLDGDIGKIECEDMDQAGVSPHLLEGYRAANLGCRIKPDHVPTKMKWQSKLDFPDYKTPMGISLISSRFKALVEKFEPGVHQFLPLEVFRKKNEKIGQLWWFITCNRIDSVDEEYTNLVLYKGSIWTHPADLIRRGEEYLLPDDYDPENEIKFAFAEGKSAGLHAWREKRLVGSPLMISDELAALLNAADLSGLDLKKAKSV